MLTPEESAYWTMLGTWFTGTATFGAVVTSLFIALRKPKSKLKVIVGERDIIAIGHPDSVEHGVSIQITNQSLQTTVVEKVVWKVKRKHWLFQQFGDPLSEKLPKKIEFGEGCDLWIKTNLWGHAPLEDGNWYADIAQLLIKSNVSPNRLTCYIITSTGQKFRVKPEKNIIERLQREIHLQKNANP
ncbi:hypothetical protein EXT60_05765 [Pectobacterium carotovorum subsp. carotovorum]|nr:hypothetical protein [Pectobacterium carotovorum]MCL6363743.1 hypothetical protein [Pectobacterium carotovorum subsp. carotovorum]